MSEQEIRSLAERGMRLNNARHRAEFMALQAPDVTWVLPDGELHGHEEILGFVTPFDEAVPDGEHLVERILADGDTAIVEGSFVGTHTGVLRTPQGDVPPSGNRVSHRFVVVIDGRDGLCGLAAVYYDRLELLARFGLVPEAAAV